MLYRAWSFVLVLWLAVLSPQAIAANMDDADAFIGQAAETGSPAEMTAHLRKAESVLVAVNAEMKSASPAAAISGRAHLIEGLLKAADLEAGGNAIEAQRFLTRSLALAKSLADVAGSAGAGPSQKLAAAARSIYGRMTRLAGPFKSPVVTYGVAGGEQLLHRVFTSDGRKIKAYELAGNPKGPSADWRQTELPAAPREALVALGEIAAGGPSSSVATVPKQAEGLPAFVLLVSGPLGRSSLAGEAALAELAVRAAKSRGLAIVVAADPTRPRPFRLVPAIAGAAAGDAVRLIYSPTASEIAAWQGVKKPADLETIVEEAWGLRDSIVRDLAIAPAAAMADIAPLLTHDAAITAPETAEILAVAKPMAAAEVDRDKTIEIIPQAELVRLTEARDGWEQFKVGEGSVVWLPRAGVGPYVEYPAALSGESGWFPFGGSAAAPPQERTLGADGALLMARPAGGARKLMALSGGDAVSVLHVEARAGASGEAADKNAKKDSDPWAFVRYGDSVGWLRLSALAPLPKPESGPPDKAAPAKKATPTEPSWDAR